MNRFQPLVRSPLVVLGRFDHPPEEPHHDPRQEIAPGYAVSFVERGCFDLQVGKRRWRLAPGMLFLTHPGLVYRCRHSEETPTDVCLSVGYTRNFAEEVQQTAKPGSRRPPAVLPLTNRLAYLHLRLAQLAAANDTEALATETLAGELLAAVVAGSSAASDKLYKTQTLAWYAERVEATRHLLETQLAQPHSLASLAGAVGISPFHFARVFRELTGTPPHRYLLNLRLSRAADRLRQGAGVTDTCFATGFNSLSHFTHLFRRRFGVPPSHLLHAPPTRKQQERTSGILPSRAH
ncbi:MAG: helix-turn-helix transcriptional regulator [Acidobacteria bacterium]|nr:helix-turn-helix transcriptional regulator [Acidobacteriota bacterium]